MLEKLIRDQDEPIIPAEPLPSEDFPLDRIEIEEARFAGRFNLVNPL